MEQKLSNNGKECCSDVSSRFFGVSVAWHPKKRLRTRLGIKMIYCGLELIHFPTPNFKNLWAGIWSRDTGHCRLFLRAVNHNMTIQNHRCTYGTYYCATRIFQVTGLNVRTDILEYGGRAENLNWLIRIQQKRKTFLSWRQVYKPGKALQSGTFFHWK